MTITGIEEVYVKFPISERDSFPCSATQDNMKKEAVVTLTLANGKAYAHPGKVFMTDNTVQTTTDTLNVWAKFPNQEDVLTPGGVVTVNLSKKNVDRFPAANISSVMHDAYKSYVYVVNDQGVVERRTSRWATRSTTSNVSAPASRKGKSSSSTACTRCVQAPMVNPVYSTQN